MIAGVRQFKLINALGREYDMTRPDALLHAPDGLGWGTEATVNRLGMTYIGINEKEIHQSPSGEMVFRTYEEYGRFLSFCQQGGLVLCYKPLETWYYCECLISIQKSEIQWENNHLICPVQFTLLSYWYEKVVAQTAEPPEPVEPNYATVTGDPAVFNARYSYPIKDLSVNIQGTQELNGYDKPWVGGAGKNLFQNRGISKTVNGITYTVNADGTVIANGTATAVSVYELFWTGTSGTSYILNGCPSGGSSNTYAMDTYNSNVPLVRDYGSGATFTRDGNSQRVRIVIFNGVTVENLVFSPMIRLSTVSDSAYEPYENIAPITTYNSVTITQTGNSETKTYDVIINENKFIRAELQGNNNIRFYFEKTIDKTITISFTPNVALTNNSLYLLVDGVSLGTRTTLTGTANEKLTHRFTLSDANYERVQQATDFYFLLYKSGVTFTVPTDVEIVNINNVYKGTLNVTTGELVVNSAYIVAYDFGSLATGSSGGLNFATYVLEEGLNPTNIISNLFETKGENSAWVSSSPCVSTSASGKNVRVYCDSTSLADFKTTYSNLVIVCDIATPQTYQLTPTQLSNLIGQNTIKADAGEVTVTYRTDARAEYKVYPYQYSYKYGDTAQNVFDISCDLPSYFKLTIFGEATNPSWRVVQNGSIVKSGKVNATIGSSQKLVINTDPKQTEIALYTLSNTRINNLYGYSDFATERIFALPQGECQVQVLTEDEQSPMVMIEVLKHV